MDGAGGEESASRSTVFRNIGNVISTTHCWGYCYTHVTSVKTRDDLYGTGGSGSGSGSGRRSSQQSTGSGSGSGSQAGAAESPRSTPKLASQQSLGSTPRGVSRQRSFKNVSEDVIKRCRAQQSASYQLSQDLHDKQVEMLERKYGGSLRARRAARTIQRAYRHYCMNRNFQKLRHSVGERRLSKRLSELGRSNTIWTDRINVDDNGNFHPLYGQGGSSESPGLAHKDFATDLRKMVGDYDPPGSRYGGDHRFYQQMTFDQGVKMDPRYHHHHHHHHQRQVGGSSPSRRRLERSPHHVEGMEGGGGVKVKSELAPSETNNNRNSYPEQNTEGGGVVGGSGEEEGEGGEGGHQAGVVWGEEGGSVDPHSVDFETLLESKETDILTDSFHSEGSTQDVTASALLSHHHRPASSSADYTSFPAPGSGGMAAPPSSSSSPYDTYQRGLPVEGGSHHPLYHHQHHHPPGFHPSHSEPQIRVDPASPRGECPYESLSPLPQDQVVKFYMNTRVKLRTRKPGDPAPLASEGGGVVKQKTMPPSASTSTSRPPDTSPIWKRKGAGVSGGVGVGGAVVLNGSLSAAVKGGGGGGEVKRMSNISETSEPDSIDGQCSSSPSSENMSVENISLISEDSVGYHNKLRMSITPDQQDVVSAESASMLSMDSISYGRKLLKGAGAGGTAAATAAGAAVDRQGGSGTGVGALRMNEKQRKRLYRIGLNLFNKKPEKGLDFLVQQGFVEGSPRSVALFFINRKGISKQMIGEFLGDLQNPFSMEVLHFFTKEIDVAGLQIDMALRKFQCYFRMPGEAQKIERLMEAFADHYCRCNPDQVKNFKSNDTVFLLAFAIIMLNTDLHNSSIKPEKKMKLDDFVKNLRGIDDGEDLDPDLLTGIYERIKQQEFKPGVDNVTQVMKMEQTFVGKKPQLALPHRRLVCYCRLYEVHDPNKKEKPGLHQREVFLLNDLLLVMKIFSRKKTGLTYNFKSSFPLCGMEIYLFETQHYKYGIQLTNNLDGKTLITFNARNDHDRQKFVEDLKESILETNGMEHLRIEEEMQRHGTAHSARDRHYANDDSHVHMYEVAKPPAPPRGGRQLSAECAVGLEKSPLSSSFTDLCADPGMKRGNSGASLDSGVVSGSVGSSGSRDDNLGASAALPGPPPVPSRPQAPSTSSPHHPDQVGKPRPPVVMHPGLPDGTEV
ncbi:uncharacterized protein LOC143284806 isoform X3 [Babylonia areolata]|uniref:uncharacterized protein LOC143284806 isoform X3 n=1 Tax=Babylonia areolata TaxID=304850 RepID=UPI003FD143BC